VYQAVWNTASGLAWQAGRGSLTADDLRHGCHCVAVGRAVSSKHLTNAELDHVLALFRLLADPDNLAHVQAWQDRDAGERRRHVHVITQAEPAYWHRIASDKFGTHDLDSLTLDQLRQISLTVRSRLNTRRERTAVAAHAPEPCPA